MIRNIFFAMTILFVAAVVPAAFAVWDGPCAEDAKKLCPGQKGMALRDCMQKSEAQLSPGCKESKERARKLLDSCKVEIEKFCEGVKPGKGRVHGCLQKRESELGAACRDAVKALRAPAAGKDSKG